MVKTRITTVEDLLRWEPLLESSQKASLSAVEPPKRIGRIKIPEDLNGLKFGELSRFWSVRTPEELFDVTAQVILHVKTAKHAPVLEMLGLVNFVSRELTRISEIWEGIPSSHTPEEIQAGVQELKFGVFGIADWYARRMGIQDHEQVFETPWIRIWTCMRNDALEAQYRRRLTEIINKKIKK